MPGQQQWKARNFQDINVDNIFKSFFSGGTQEKSDEIFEQMFSGFSFGGLFDGWAGRSADIKSRVLLPLFITT